MSKLSRHASIRELISEREIGSQDELRRALFRRGHRVRLDVTSSSFPRFSRNLNTGEDVGTGTRMQVAHQTVLHDNHHPSRLVLPIGPVSIPK